MCGDLSVTVKKRQTVFGLWSHVHVKLSYWGLLSHLELVGILLNILTLKNKQEYFKVLVPCICGILILNWSCNAFKMSGRYLKYYKKTEDGEKKRDYKKAEAVER